MRFLHTSIALLLLLATTLSCADDAAVDFQAAFNKRFKWCMTGVVGGKQCQENACVTYSNEYIRGVSTKLIKARGLKFFWPAEHLFVGEVRKKCGICSGNRCSSPPAGWQCKGNKAVKYVQASGTGVCTPNVGCDYEILESDDCSAYGGGGKTCRPGEGCKYLMSGVGGENDYGAVAVMHEGKRLVIPRALWAKYARDTANNLRPEMMRALQRLDNRLESVLRAHDYAYWDKRVDRSKETTLQAADRKFGEVMASIMGPVVEAAAPKGADKETLKKAVAQARKDVESHLGALAKSNGVASMTEHINGCSNAINKARAAFVTRDIGLDIGAARTVTGVQVTAALAVTIASMGAASGFVASGQIALTSGTTLTMAGSAAAQTASAWIVTNVAVGVTAGVVKHGIERPLLGKEFDIDEVESDVINIGISVGAALVGGGVAKLTPTTSVATAITGRLAQDGVMMKAIEWATKEAGKKAVETMIVKISFSLGKTLGSGALGKTMKVIKDEKDLKKKEKLMDRALLLLGMSTVFGDLENAKPEDLAVVDREISRLLRADGEPRVRKADGKPAGVEFYTAPKVDYTKVLDSKDPKKVIDAAVKKSLKEIEKKKKQGHGESSGGDDPSGRNSNGGAMKEQLVQDARVSDSSSSGGAKKEQLIQDARVSDSSSSGGVKMQNVWTTAMKVRADPSKDKPAIGFVPRFGFVTRVAGVEAKQVRSMTFVKVKVSDRLEGWVVVKSGAKQFFKEKQ
eukprot:TRINITY_DN17769_c0_g1_i1.p1 TRINITY_DN17769_c0_g1~~TRINITY_DN17769_c0_g1_i1.p1  ORF type:complete len:758 (-),score=409.89 TRINITY_DN17769_c0_g1_i1:174-2402(-)